MAVSRLLTPGCALIVAGNLMYSVGAFVADYNETHVLNPRWPPHAKFHNGQTMSLGILLASTSIGLLYHAVTGPRAAAKTFLFWSAAVGSFYTGAGMSAILYPGTAWIDPEFKQYERPPQQGLFTGIVVMMWVGYFLERRNMA